MEQMVRIWILAIAAMATGSVAVAQQVPRVPPLAPRDALRTFRVADGMRMRLLAAEPLVTDPVDLVYDENGLAYVAEMRGYPYPANDHRTPAGRIRVLWDEDGDGVFDRSKIFADGLHWPTSVAVWRGGLYVLAPPDLWYLKDTDGDRIADIRRRVCTGFGTYNVQAVANNLKWAIDGRFYGAGSGNGGLLRWNGRTLSLRRQDFSFDPLTEQFRVETGAGRFGNCFDDWGNRFICNIRNPVLHIVIDYRYLARNPITAIRSGMTDVAEAGDQVPVYPIAKPEPWRLLRARRWAVDPRGIPRSELVGIGFFTSACGITVYRGDAYPASFRNQVFIAEVANNLVHRRRLIEAGVTFRSERIDEASEVVASTDNWFRPVNFCNAPDGTLHIVDMYREVIEHPWSIPDELLAKLDLVSGVDRGRLYRLEPDGFRPRARPQLRSASPARLVELLDHPAAWWSETAHRLLIERQHQEAVPLLRQAVGTARTPRGRLLALWALHRLGGLSEIELGRALQDPDRHVREQAVRVAEAYLDRAPVQAALLRLARDPAVRVRFRLALVLGELTQEPRATDALIQLAVADGRDRWFATAIASSAAGRAMQLYNGVLRQLAPRSVLPEYRELLELLVATAAREATPQQAASLLQGLAGMPEPLRLLLATAAMGELRRRGVLNDPELQAERKRLVRLTLDAVRRATEPAELARALDALRTVATYTEARRMLLELARCGDPDLAGPAVRTIGTFADRVAGEDLLALWHDVNGPLRTAVILQLLRRTTWIELVFDAVETGRLPVQAVPAQRRWLLTQHPSEAIAHRAKRLFGSLGATNVSSAEVQRVVAKVLRLNGDVRRGRELFRRECSACHRLEGIGQPIAPDLASVRRRGPAEVLMHILDPNREIAPEFVQYSVLLRDGRSLAGAIEHESGESIQLVLQDGSRELIQRADIEQIQPLGISLMPTGFGEKLTPQELADLLAFLLRVRTNPQPND